MNAVPDRFDFGPHPWRVELKAGMSDSADLLGRCDHRTHTIELEPEQQHSGMAEVLLHELLHVCLAAMELPEKREERLVNTLAPSLLMLLRANPDVARYLTEG